MAGKINRAPWGFLSLLQSKSLGQQPDAISELVRPGLDMAPFYWASQRLTVRFAEQVGAAIGAYATVAVPNDEVWYVHGVSCRCTASGAAANFRFVLRCLVDTVPSGQTFFHLSDVDFVDSMVAANESTSRNWSPGYPIIFPAGSQFQVWNSTVVVNPVTFRTMVLATVLSV